MNHDVIERYLRAMAAHDWDGMAACLAPDVYRVGPYGDVYTPREPYVEFIAGIIPTLPGYVMEVHRVVYAGRIGVAELSETVVLDGAPLRTDEALVFDIDEAGLLSRIAVYIQTSNAARKRP